MGWAALRSGATAMPDETKAALASCHGWLMGPHDSASYPPAEQERRNPSGELRHHFDLFANIRPARGWPGVPAVAPAADLVIVRENTEGFYPDRNMYVGSASGCRRPISPSRSASSRGGRRGGSRKSPADLAQARRRRLTIVHKANVIRLGTGLFLEECRAVAAELPRAARWTIIISTRWPRIWCGARRIST